MTGPYRWKSGHHGLFGYASSGHVRHLLVQHLYGRLCLDDVITDEHGYGHQNPAVGKGDDQKREKYVEWFGYSASVSPYILRKFEEWAGYKFRPEFIVDQGYHNSLFRVPSKEFKDFINFQQQEVCKLAKELVEYCA